LTALTQRTPEPIQEVKYRWKGVFHFLLFGSKKRFIITVIAVIIIAICYKVFKKKILIFLYEIIRVELLLMLQ
jgi:hypothetical protein